MRISSVNVSLAKVARHGRHEVLTGIFKEPVEGRVAVRGFNLAGDQQADPSCHGGPNKAVYAYAIEHYAHWADRLGRSDLLPGQFGENLTTAGWLERDACLGDVVRIGGALLRVAQARVPCFKLALKMGSAKFPDVFLESGRTGIYLAVVAEGDVGVGDEITLVERGKGGVSIHDLWRLAYGGDEDPVLVRKTLEHDTLGPEWRKPLERAL